MQTAMYIISVVLNNELVFTSSKLSSVFVTGSNTSYQSLQVRLVGTLESTDPDLPPGDRGAGPGRNDDRVLPAGVSGVLVVLVVSSTQQYSLN